MEENDSWDLPADMGRPLGLWETLVSIWWPPTPPHLHVQHSPRGLWSASCSAVLVSKTLWYKGKANIKTSETVASCNQFREVETEELLRLIPQWTQNTPPDQGTERLSTASRERQAAFQGRVEGWSSHVSLGLQSSSSHSSLLICDSGRCRTLSLLPPMSDSDFLCLTR